MKVKFRYLCLSDTALKKTFMEISCSVGCSQRGLQEVVCPVKASDETVVPSYMNHYHKERIVVFV